MGSNFVFISEGGDSGGKLSDQVCKILECILRENLKRSELELIKLERNEENEETLKDGRVDCF